MSQTLSVSEANMDNYILSVTTRENGDDPKHLEGLTYRTIKIWLWIVSHLEQQIYKLPDNPGSVESRYAEEITRSQLSTDAPPAEPFAFEPAWGDARVTCWDTYRGSKRINFHLNSDDDLQVAVDTWLAQRRALERAVTDFATPQQKVAQQAASQSNVEGQKTGAAVDMKPATPKAQNNPPNAHPAPPAPSTGGIVFTKKEAIANLRPFEKFRMKVCQIKKRSKDGEDYYEFYEMYGGKPGDFGAVSVFVDSEIAINNGLIAYLDTFGIKLGGAIIGEWILNCSVGKPKTKMVKGEEKTFTNIYVNSFEGQELGDLA